MDPELKELLEKAKEVLGNHAETKKVLDEIRAWGAESGRLAEAEKAVKQVNDEMKELRTDVDKRIGNIQRQAFDANGKYRGRAFASAGQALTFGLAALCFVPQFSAQAKEMLESDHKEFLERAGVEHAGESSLLGHEHFRRIQRLVDDYSVFARRAYPQIMNEATGTFHRRTTGLRARKTKVRSQIPEQALAWVPINLTADDFDILVSYPITLDEDAIITFAEVLAEEMGLGFAIAIEEDGFVGDVTAAYDGVAGLTHRLSTINGVDDGGGLVLSSGAAASGWGGLAHDDVLKLIGQARYVRPGQGALYCSNEFFWQVLAKFIKASGGRTSMETQNGPGLQFEGTPVEITPVMPRATGSSQIPLLFGDLHLSSTLGSRRVLSFRESREARFESKEIVMLASSAFDINNHTLGDADTAGPVVGLITAAAS